MDFVSITDHNAISGANNYLLQNAGQFDILCQARGGIINVQLRV